MAVTTIAGCVMCGVDGSASAPALARTAAGVARVLDAPLELVHVLGPGSTDTEAPAPEPGVDGPWRSAAEAKTAEEALVARAQAMLDGLVGSLGVPDVFRQVVSSGEPGRRLARLAHDHTARMIVVSGRGTVPVDEALLGSVSSRLAADAPCPVLVIAGGREQEIDPGQWRGRALVCGLDGSRPACAAALHAADLAIALGGTLIAVSVDRSPDTVCLERLRRRLAGTGVQLNVDARGGDPADTIERVAAAATAPLIAVGSRGLGPRTDALLGSVCLSLLRHARRPILVTPATAVA